MLLLASLAVALFARYHLADPTPYGPTNWRRIYVINAVETGFWAVCVLLAAIVLLLLLIAP